MKFIIIFSLKYPASLFPMSTVHHQQARPMDTYFGNMMKTQPGPEGGLHPPLTLILTFLTSKEFHEKLPEFENPVPTTTCWRLPCAVTCPLGTAQPPGHGSRSSVLAFQRIGSCAYWQDIAGLIDRSTNILILISNISP